MYCMCEQSLSKVINFDCLVFDQIIYFCALVFKRDHLLSCQSKHLFIIMPNQVQSAALRGREKLDMPGMPMSASMMHSKSAGSGP